ncbi:MAG TPA: phytoene/squalene synthase family protein [Opitutaceae bacterium]|jgi:phytoene synthase|nr:phytoene/squalene synthase family protein [Opitutaceae bacterium]
MSELERAYAECRAIAKREAKNFYYAFLALPPARRNAICAVYAFMRRADDIADDESLPREERRRRLEAFVGEWKKVDAASPSLPGAEMRREPGARVYLALRDATRRFNIPDELLDQLVAGVAMDLDEGAATQTYATFADLYRYCYLVASVVGLICIRIFGYRDPTAEKLAEETGVALQLTNILRDVLEDAGRNRLYLPLDLAAAHGVAPAAVLRHPAGQPPAPNERALLEEIAARAENYYDSARRLLPLIDQESRPALWVLVTIYHRLLGRIRAADYDVFSRRASVPRAQKLGILLVGQVRTLLARGFAGG